MGQQIMDIENVDLLNKVLNMRNSGYRLGQICAIKLEKLMLLYTFIKDEEFITFRVTCDIGEPVESISRLYSYSYLYENEMKDLFGINIQNMRIDYKGHFYETVIKTPFNPVPKAGSDTDPEKSEIINNG